jgi:hypothetical protein
MMDPTSARRDDACDDGVNHQSSQMFTHIVYVNGPFVLALSIGAATIVMGAAG